MNGCHLTHKVTVLKVLPWVADTTQVELLKEIFHQTLNRNISNRPMRRKYACWSHKDITGLVV